MKYLEKTFTVPVRTPEQKNVKREGRTTYAYCKPCAKVHEVGYHELPPVVVNDMPPIQWEDEK